MFCTLRKHAHSNTLKISPPKIEHFQIKKKKKLTFFHISAQNIDCGYSLEPLHRGGSNEYPQSIFSSREFRDEILKGMTLGSNGQTLRTENKWSVKFSSLASFYQLGTSSDPHMFSKNLGIDSVITKDPKI